MFVKFMSIYEELKSLLWVTPKELYFRILTSFIPPIIGKYKKVSVDLLGPTIAFIILIVILNYGNTFKQTIVLLPPYLIVSLYVTFMPIMCFVFHAVSQSRMKFLENLAILGYALYGHIVTLLVSLLVSNERNDLVFFICLTVFAGLSTFRLVLLEEQSIPLPGARFLVCSIVSVMHILFLVFLHYNYMHPNFVYGKNSNMYNSFSI